MKLKALATLLILVVLSSSVIAQDPSTTIDRGNIDVRTHIDAIPCDDCTVENPETPTSTSGGGGGSKRRFEQMQRLHNQMIAQCQVDLATVIHQSIFNGVPFNAVLAFHDPTYARCSYEMWSIYGPLFHKVFS